MSIDPRDYVVSSDAEISDLDLKTEEFRFQGQRLTDQRAADLAAQTLAGVRRRNLRAGRKSLTGGDAHSPRVQFRVPENIRAEAENRAKSEHLTLSKLARRALERYLAEVPAPHSVGGVSSEAESDEFRVEHPLVPTELREQPLEPSELRVEQPLVRTGPPKRRTGRR